MDKNVKDFIKHNATEGDRCYSYDAFSKDIKQMLKNIYSCCFRFGLYKSQILFLLNSSLEPFTKEESLLFDEVGGWE